MLQSCNINFISQYAFVDNKQIHISEYKEIYKDRLLCQNGHELISVINVKKMKPYFRHKNKEDTNGYPMTKWHCEWQSYFPTIEKCFPCKLNQIKERRCDVVLNETTVLEIQHSKYERKEIDNRKNDYSLHNINIIWLIDGDKTISVTKLNTSNRVYLEFTSEYWKYESFKSYEYIFIDINSTIYKINPNKIKSHMIDVEIGKPKELFIEYLKNIDTMNIWLDEEPIQCNLFIKQQGAGNGKTYGILKMLEDDDKIHYNNFIYITKQHSAKHIIKATFEEINNDALNKFRYLKNIVITESNKKYIIKYFNEKTLINCTIIIATIDAFTYSIGNKNHTYRDKFEGLIYSIFEDGFIESTNCGKINFAGVNPKLNKETLLVLDEFQDPPSYYAKAIVRIMLDKYIDVYIVGDKLQSISNEDNAFVYFCDNIFPSINTIKIDPTNICRRFTHPKLVEFVNFMIPFNKYNLPEIKPYKENINNDFEPITFFSGKFINPNLKTEKNEELISSEVEKIMYYYELDVNTNNRFPEDFLIVTPFTSKNPLVNALELAINIFWKDKFTNDQNYMNSWKKSIQQEVSDKEYNKISTLLNLSVEDYYRYAIFHKSEEGNSIDLSESEYSTRIVSCHSSKGDGRKVVFIIGFEETAIRVFSKLTNNLVFDSLLHVALTRMKEKIYIRYLDNGDYISHKLNEYFSKNNIFIKDITPKININDFIKLDLINNNNYELLNESIIKFTKLQKLDETKSDKKIIDMGNHMLRYASLIITTELEIVNKEKINNLDVKRQLQAKLFEITTADITCASSMKGYYCLLEIDKEIPLIKISDRGKDYIHYYNIIYDNMKNLQLKIKKFLKNTDTLTLCPIECIILYYMLQLLQLKKQTNINIIDLYNIIDVYKYSFDSSNLEHKNCLCNKHFKDTCCLIKSKKIDEMKLYLMNHFDKINDIKYTISIITNKYPALNWLINHYISFESGNDIFKLGKRFDLIGYDNSTVVFVYIKPQFNSLNYNDILIKSIIDTYLLKHVKKNDMDDELTEKISNNYVRFNGKKIVTIVITLEHIEPYIIEWNNNEIDLIDTNNSLITNIIYNYMLDKYTTENTTVYYFYIYWRKHCPENKSSPTKFIQFLKENLSVQKEIIKYVHTFFIRLEFEIELIDGKNNKENALQKYENKDYFMEKINNYVSSCIKKFLYIDDE
jgi:hypothetical protein